MFSINLNAQKLVGTLPCPTPYPLSTHTHARAQHAPTHSMHTHAACTPTQHARTHAHTHTHTHTHTKLTELCIVKQVFLCQHVYMSRALAKEFRRPVYRLGHSKNKLKKFHETKKYKRDIMLKIYFSASYGYQQLLKWPKTL